MMSENTAGLPALLSLQATVVRKAPSRLAEGVVQGTQVLTMDGMLPVEYLHEGDRIITRSGMRRLKRLDVTEYEAAPACHIASSVLGHDRPESDITVGPATALHIRDWRAKVLYGRDEVLVQAGRLVDNTYITLDETTARRRFFSLVFDTREIFYAGGLEVASAS